MTQKNVEIEVEKVNSDEDTVPLNKDLNETTDFENENGNEVENDNENENYEEYENEGNDEENGIGMIANEMNGDNDIEIGSEIVKSGNEKEMYECGASEAG